MGKINYGRVVLGGIVAGIVACVLDWFFNGVLLGQLWTDNMNRLNLPNALSGPFLPFLFLVYAVGGILVIWLYAAILPRFGAGVRTAVYLALVMWAIGTLTTVMMAVQGIYTTRLALLSTLFGIVEGIIGTVAGAALYKEAESTAAYPAADARQTTR
jgi:hypothetical protein